MQVLLLLFFFGGCAKMGSLTGGYKDEVPPVLISSKPLNFSVNFNSEKIELEFDEYIALKNVNQELIISPPLPKKPVVRIKNKSVIIDLKNELRQNTTYTLNFGKSITDNNEGNPLTNFEFVFSTGTFLDSLSVKGNLLNSFNLLPSKEPFVVGLYHQSEDSVPMKSIPVYISKTDTKGLFQINNIKADTFKIFALKDLNYNLLYDLPNEEIGFADTLLILTPEFLSSLPERIAAVDTLSLDTVDPERPEPTPPISDKKKEKKSKRLAPAVSLPDTAAVDSFDQKVKLPELYVDMFYFLPEATKQYMTNNERISRENFQLCFSLPLKDNPGIEVLGFEAAKPWYLPEISARRDTFTYWITDTSLISRDTISLQIAYPMKDSVGVTYTQLDTIKFISRKPLAKATKSKSDSKKAEAKNPEGILTPTSIRNNGILDFNVNLPFTFNYPLQRVDTSFLKLYARIDTLEVLQNYKFEIDSFNLRMAYLECVWKEKTKYRLEALPGAFNDIYKHTNDTVVLKFSIQEKAFYGTLTLTLSEVGSPLFVQLMNEKEQVLRTATAVADGPVLFEFLSPAKYKLKFIYDTNSNGKWDTGDYTNKIQPERVSFYKGEINIRSNWDLEVKESFKQ